ncbi:hypothetical protein [Sandaracinus amylolyticus]|uniref:Uncharacterized protein n=1 Tax=Sandaracinus amylolyticus TaxID=927083 RepID=A0A0F6W8U3_9BACT|nr:hypothetical protein [Sandaracinus amylolyticus]AKF10336.1 hypothetical protein DB32_007485 [Sandaracinus amylolyticus]
MPKAWTNEVVARSLGVALCAGCAAQPSSPPATVVTHGGEQARATAPALIEVDESALAALPEVTAPGPTTVAAPTPDATPAPIEAAEVDADVEEDATALACPSDVAGLEARAVTTARGAALVLRTSEPEQVDELRRRVRELASALDEERRERATITHTPRFAASGAMHETHEVRLHDVARGVRMELIAREGDAAARRELRDELRDDARVLGEGRCPLRFQTT